MNDDYKKIQDITESIKVIISDILNEKLQPEDIDNDTPLFLNGLGLDSIDLLQLIPFNRFSKPIEIAKVINFLISEDASYINCANIIVDGGLT